jgi:hypothetical protein
MAAPARAHPQQKMKSEPPLLLPPIRGPFFASSWRCSLGSGFLGKACCPGFYRSFLEFRSRFFDSPISHPFTFAAIETENKKARRLPPGLEFL